jgi:hypothetical protein
MIAPTNSARRPKRSAPIAITFVLSGRRTLSEHLPGEEVHVPFSVVQRSSHLRSLLILKPALPNQRNTTISLPDIDPAGFRLYVEWLRSGRITYTVDKPQFLRDCIDLIFAHIVGSKLEEVAFQDYIIDKVAACLDPSQTPDLKVLEIVLLEKGASNVLKRFIVDRMFALEKRMLGMIRGFVELVNGEEQEGGEGCEYHVHEGGECYRECEAAGRNNMSRYGQGVRVECPGRVDPHRLQYSEAEDFTDRTSTYTMANNQYFGSSDWCREVHGIKRQTPSPENEKPLPPIPPLTPGTSPSPPSSPTSPIRGVFFNSPLAPYHRSSVVSDTPEAPSTQQLILECLSRIPPPPSPTSSSNETSVQTGNALPDLILECLGRMRADSDTTASIASSFSYDSLPKPKILPVLSSVPTATPREETPSKALHQGDGYTTYRTLDEPRVTAQRETTRGSPSRAPCSSPLPRCTPSPPLRAPTAPSHAHPPSSFQAYSPPIARLSSCIPRTLPALPRLQSLSPPLHSYRTPVHAPPPPPHTEPLPLPLHAEILPLPPHNERPASLSPPPSHLPPTVKRRAAPPRGTDWLTQYDRVNTLMTSNKA